MPNAPRPRAPRPVAGIAFALAALVAACGGAATGAPGAGSAPPAAPATPATPSTPPGSASVSPTPSAAALPSTSPAALSQPWATAELTDVATGERFTIAALTAAGRPVVVETMAIWCTSCLAQQRRIEEALGRVGEDAAAYVVLAVDPAEDAAKLARYRELHGFGGRYAVAGADVSRALAADFGDQVLNPPATPVIVIAPSGRVTLTEYGPKSSEAIVRLIEEHRA